MAFNQNSKYLEDNILNWLKGTAFPAAPSGLYLGLMTTAPTASNATGTEASYTGYARQAVTLGSLAGTTALGSGDSASSTAQVTFPTNNSGSTVTVQSFALFDAATAGNMLVMEEPASAVNIPNGTALQFNAGQVTVTQI